ncbi:MAG: hypothetical protein LC104_21485, partial [Bacteroidales bacterium]|nr:hypothetical protein [Bacteroidales bacterium]
MSWILRPPGALDSLPERLGELGRVRRRVAIAIAVFQLLAIGSAAVLSACLLDVAFHLPGWLRAVFLTGILTTFGILVRTGIHRSWRLSTQPLDVALLLEDRFPRFNDALASAVSFLTASETHASRHSAARFRDLAVTRAENIARKCNFDTIITSGRAWKWFWFAALVSALTLVGFTLSPTRALLAVVRLADPYGDHVYPTRTTIELLEPSQFPALLAKGDPFLLQFAVHGVIPEQVFVSIRQGETLLEEHALPVPPENGNHSQAGAQLSYRLDPARAAQSFAVRIVAHDADTDWLTVTVAPPPKLVPRDGRPSPQFRLDFPAYTDLPSVDLPDGAGVVEAVVGTQFHLRAATDRRIVSAAFHAEGDWTSVQTGMIGAALMSDNPLSLTAALLLTEEFVRPIPVRVSGVTGTHLDARFSPPMPGLYTLRFVDEVGLTGVRLFNFETFPDPAPNVSLIHPHPLSDPMVLLPTAQVTVQARAEDRTFAARHLLLEYRIGGPESVFQTLSLTDRERVQPYLPALVGSLGVMLQKPVGLDARVTLPVAAFTRPDGSPPVDGDSITLRAAATDWDTVAWTKPPGRSAEITLRILARSAMEAMLQKQLAEMRPELLRQREVQRDARRIIEEVAQSQESGTVKPEDPGKLARAEQAQRQIRNALSDPDAGIRTRAEKLLQTVRANNLPDSPTTERLADITHGLTRLVEQH